MEWLNLSLEIRERAGVELTETAIGRIETVRDLLREVIEAKAAHSDPASAAWLENPDAALTARQHRWLKPHGFFMGTLQGLLHLLDRFLLNTLFQLRVEGADHIPAGRPFVLVPNHLSYLDAPALAAALSNAQLSNTFWGGWTGVMTTNLLSRTLSRIAHVIPIDPERALVSSLAFGAAVLKKRKNLVWFPEGSISPTGKLQPFKLGLGILLARYPIMAIPVAIEGTDRALPHGKRWPRLRAISVRFGPAVCLAESTDMGSTGMRPDQITEALQNAVANLLRRDTKQLGLA